MVLQPFSKFISVGQLYVGKNIAHQGVCASLKEHLHSVSTKLHTKCVVVLKNFQGVFVSIGVVKVKELVEIGKAKRGNW